MTDRRRRPRRKPQPRAAESTSSQNTTQPRTQSRNNKTSTKTILAKDRFSFECIAQHLQGHAVPMLDTDEQTLSIQIPANRLQEVQKGIHRLDGSVGNGNWNGDRDRDRDRDYR